MNAGTPTPSFLLPLNGKTSQAGTQNPSAGSRSTSSADPNAAFSNMLSLLSAAEDPVQQSAETTALATANPSTVLTDGQALPIGTESLVDAVMQWMPYSLAQEPLPVRSVPAVSADGPLAGANIAVTQQVQELAGTPLPGSAAQIPSGALPLAAIGQAALPQGMQVVHPGPLANAPVLTDASVPAIPLTEPIASAGQPTVTAPVSTAAATQPQPPALSDRAPTILMGTQALQQGSSGQDLLNRQSVQMHFEVNTAVRSTVTLGGRFTPNEEALGSTENDVSNAWGTSAALMGLVGARDPSGHSGAQGEAGAHPAPAEPLSESDPIDFAEPTDGTGEAPSADDSDLYASPNLRQAQLRIGEAGKDALEIQLTLTGRELDLGFRSDNADTRQALASGVDDTLSELLQRSSLQLGEVTVGEQRGQASDGGSHQGGSRKPPATQAQSQPPTEGTVPPPTDSARPRSDGSRPLDLFV